MGEKRTETDTFGPIEVPAECYYGAQTARSMKYFNIGLPTGKYNLHFKIIFERILHRSNATSINRSIWFIKKIMCNSK
jgi:fumarate hydratase class II